jgi:outer membrane protein TolC
VGACLAAGACTVGPRYATPPVVVPPAYKEAAAGAGAGAGAGATPIPGGGAWRPANPQDEASKGAWWHVYGDADLDALLARIDVSNQNVKAAEAQFAQARALVRVSRAAYAPTVTVDPTVTRSHVSANRTAAITTVGRTNTDHQFPFDVSYEADVWGKVKNSVAGSVAAYQASGADLESMRLSLRAELAADYFQARAIDAQAALLDETIAAFEHALTLTEARHTAGVVSGADVAQAQTQLETARAQHIDLGVQRAQFEHAIAVLVGEAPASFTLPVRPLGAAPAAAANATATAGDAGAQSAALATDGTKPSAVAALPGAAGPQGAPGIAGNPGASVPGAADASSVAAGGSSRSIGADLLAPPEVPVGLPSTLLERRPDVAAAERRVRQANANIGVAKAAYFPALTLAGSAGFESIALATWFSWPSALWSVGTTVSQTLFDGGARRATVAQNQAAYDGAVATYRQTVLGAFQDVEDNLSTLHILANEARQQEAAVQAARKSLDLAMAQYTGGVTSYLDVITAQNALLANQRTALTVLGQRMVASVQLIKALGGGWDRASLPQ